MSTPESFAAAYAGLDHHTYEVIRQTCWLHFDLDLKDEDTGPGTRDVTRAEHLQHFYMILRAFSYEVLGSGLTDGSIIELDSSTAAKFSKHIIVRDVAFPDNISMGRIVNLLREYGRERGLIDMIDAAVYSKNMCFRLLAQSKYGREVVLHVAPDSPIARSDTATQMLLTMA